MTLLDLLRQERKITGKIRFTARVLKHRFKRRAKSWLIRLRAMTAEELETVMTRFLEKKSLEEIFEGFEYREPLPYRLVEEIYCSHDKLFRETYSRRYCAIAFLRYYLPRAIVRKMDFLTWKLEPGSYIDEKLRENESDLVYRIKYGGKDTWVYLLFEHQSTEDPMMPFRLLNYMVNLWKQILKENSDLKKLPALLPMVLSQSESGWNVSTHFQDLLDLPKEERAELLPYIPDFEHVLVDLSGLDDEEIQGEVYGRLVLHLMKAASQGILIETVEKHALLIRELLHQENAMGLLETLLRYALNNLKDENEKTVLQQLLTNNINQKVGGTIMTLAEQLVQKGEIKGEIKGAAGIIAKGLKKRFQDQATPWLARLQTMTSAQLETIMDRLLENKSLKEVFQGIETQSSELTSM